MNNDICLMLELQRYRDAVVRGNADLISSKKTIAENQSNIKKSDEVLEANRNEIKVLKAELKKSENQLAEKESTLKAIDEKRQTVQTQKEFEAVEHEYNRVKSESDLLEEKILESMDGLSDAEEKFLNLEKSSVEAVSGYEEKINTFQERMERFSTLIKENEEKFQDKIGGLSPQIRSRFSKLVQSNDGKGIYHLEGSNCGGCHVTLPDDVTVSGNKLESITNCPHCGKYLYSKDIYKDC